MERRWTTRTRMGLNVDVAFEGGALTGCRTRDIGLGGVFVDSGDQLPLGQFVEITFKVPDGSAIEDAKIRAKVVRTVSEGMGFMFRDFDATAFRALQRVMRVKDSAFAP